MNILRQPLIVGWLSVSFIVMLVSILLSIFVPSNLFVVIIAVLLAQVSGSVLFPILVGYFYDKIKERETGEAIWRLFKEFSEGGILRVYKDREENENPENALSDLRNTFLGHANGDVKLIGVSLRVFFNPTGPFYEGISSIAQRGTIDSNIKIKALVSDPSSPECVNRAKVETPGLPDPLIERDISLTIANLEYLKGKSREDLVQYGYYQEAPYCTLVIFPGRCYYSPNLLSAVVPVRLPMIVFREGSHGYDVLNRYFDHLWEHRM